MEMCIAIVENFREEGREYWMHKWPIFVTNQDLEESGSEERIVEAVEWRMFEGSLESMPKSESCLLCIWALIGKVPARKYITGSGDSSGS